MLAGLKPEQYLGSYRWGLRHRTNWLEMWITPWALLAEGGLGDGQGSHAGRMEPGLDPRPSCWKSSAVRCPLEPGP